MQYLILIYENESTMPEPPKDRAEFEAWMAPWAEYTQALQGAGVMLGGNALQPTATATTVTVRGGETAITDGPFAETSEQLGGYYLLDCKDLDQALSWAKKCPAAKTGKIEVRPIADFGQPPQ